jgi:hypothetical protein
MQTKQIFCIEVMIDFVCPHQRAIPPSLGDGKTIGLRSPECASEPALAVVAEVDGAAAVAAAPIPQNREPRKEDPMLEDPRLERIYEGVELVGGGVGNPTARTMCIMSFVACLAGEGRTDAPLTASPVIRSFAIVVNDRMPPDVRRRLKPFAPRIIGTNDGLDEIRAEVLRRALTAEILPKVLGEHRKPTSTRRRRGVFGRAWVELLKGSLRRRIVDLLDEAAYDHRPGLGIDFAHGAGQMISLCALEATTADDEGWYWKAIEVLDRLCSVGAEGRVPRVRPDRLEWLERILAAHGRIVDRGDAQPTSLSTLVARFPGA